ncbi:hypothetical protein CPB83DRAFT_889197 [Crepidotus variabilis]|uniref:ER membrane protein complex subunit 10 n=1 Tax=Crepidotus variabilis TaxID=179855 RepID=A0A9P6ESS4_9AGAR|nr:hypothetical protein CPB83DRAFT_889197 [Crepidotus variabilis]
MKSSSLVVLFAATFLGSAGATENAVLYHRIFHPSFPDLKYLERGSVSGSPPTFQPSESLAEGFKTFSEALQSLEGDPSGVLYQVALARADDKSQATYDFSSVKLCHLNQANKEHIYLHVSDDDTPFALDYFVGPIPKDGSCPRKISSSTSITNFAPNYQKLNTTVVMRRPSMPPLPDLRTPPPISPEGQVVEPVPEKSFLQKYWMYMVGLLIFFLVAAPEEAEQPKRGGAAK